MGQELDPIFPYETIAIFFLGNSISTADLSFFVTFFYDFFICYRAILTSGRFLCIINREHKLKSIVWRITIDGFVYVKPNEDYANAVI